MNKAIIVLGVVMLIAVGTALMYGERILSRVATPLIVHQAEPGIRCATMVTGDGVAIDCWKDDEHI